jgi:TPP-dependent pyruvate/acetoin dehydrogenase alpha subunit
MNAFTERLQRFERRLLDDMHNIFCPTHLCLGQEEVPAALHEHLKPADWLFSTHRAHGHALAKGVSEQALWDEIHGLETGLNQGFAGSQGFVDPSVNFHCSAIVGGLIGVATGTAYALKLNQADAIAVCCIGDAGTEQGVFWEAANFAVLNKLPIAFICENNQYSVDAHISERQATPMSSRAKAFGLHLGGSVEGAIRFARGNVPSFHEQRVTRACNHLDMACLLDYAGKK